MDSTHDIKRFAEPVLSLLRQKITQSLTDVPYMTPLTNITETVMDKTGVTPNISDLPKLIKEDMGHHVLIILNQITDSGFFEDERA